MTDEGTRHKKRAVVETRTTSGHSGGSFEKKNNKKLSPSDIGSKKYKALKFHSNQLSRFLLSTFVIIVTSNKMYYYISLRIEGAKRGSKTSLLKL